VLLVFLSIATGFSHFMLQKYFADSLMRERRILVIIFWTFFASFFMREVYQIVLFRYQDFLREEFFIRYVLEDVAPLFFDATSMIAIFVLHHKNFS
jgi:hypothetical protein